MYPPKKTEIRGAHPSKLPQVVPFSLIVILLDLLLPSPTLPSTHPTTDSSHHKTPSLSSSPPDLPQKRSDEMVDEFIDYITSLSPDERFQLVLVLSPPSSPLLSLPKATQTFKDVERKYLPTFDMLPIISRDLFAY